MVTQDFIAKMRIVEVEIDFGCGDALMPEHLLYGTEICSAFEQMGGERVP